MKRRIDLNGDIGETPLPWHESHEPDLLRLITSANVACGGHAGDAASMMAVCKTAQQHGVAVGAQVSYPDREGFGRVAMDLEPAVLARSLSKQFEDLDEIARSAGATIRHLKPHGALYNTVVDRIDHAEVVVDLAARQEVALFGLSDSATESLAKDRGVRFVREWFVDRRYLHNGRLTPRSRPDALITSVTEIEDRIRQAVLYDRVSTVDADDITVDFETICIHSDTPDAGTLVQAVRRALLHCGVEIAVY
jgi:UPF0271 protein